MTLITAGNLKHLKFTILLGNSAEMAKQLKTVFCLAVTAQVRRYQKPTIGTSKYPHLKLTGLPILRHIMTMLLIVEYVLSTV